MGIVMALAAARERRAITRINLGASQKPIKSNRPIQNKAFSSFMTPRLSLMTSVAERRVMLPNLTFGFVLLRGGGGGLVLRPIATSTSEFQTVVTTRHNATMSGLNNTDKHTNPLFRLPLRVCVLFTFMLPLAVPSRGPEQTMPQRTHPSRQVGLNDDKGFQISEREFLCQN